MNSVVDYQTPQDDCWEYIGYIPTHKTDNSSLTTTEEISSEETTTAENFTTTEMIHTVNHEAEIEGDEE